MLRVGRLTAAGITFEKLALPVAAKNGRLRVDPAEARAFGGRVWMRVAMDVTGARPRLRFQPRFVDVDAQQMLDQTIGVKQLTGRARIEATLDGTGADVAALKRSLRGPFDISVNDGVLIGADLWHEIERAFAVAQGRQPPSGKGSGRTEFDVLLGRGTLANMTLRNESLEFSTDFVRVRGRGDVNFGSGTVDLRLKARMLRVPPGRLLGMETSQLEGADVPVTVTGRIDDPKVRPDVAALLGEVVKRKATEQLEEKLRRKLQDLLGR
jgi:AsmA protein